MALPGHSLAIQIVSPWPGDTGIIPAEFAGHAGQTKKGQDESSCPLYLKINKS